MKASNSATGRARAAVLLALFCSTVAWAADSPQFKRAKELSWTAVPGPAGAHESPLWSEPSGNAVLVRWPFSTKLPEAVQSKDLHIVVLTGTVTFDVSGRHNEIGPGGFATIPAGVAHTMGCESSGECTFLMHLADPENK